VVETKSTNLNLISMLSVDMMSYSRTTTSATNLWFTLAAVAARRRRLVPIWSEGLHSATFTASHKFRLQKTWHARLRFIAQIPFCIRRRPIVNILRILWIVLIIWYEYRTFISNSRSCSWPDAALYPVRMFRVRGARITHNSI
jgi:hypothetical protein